MGETVKIFNSLISSADVIEIPLSDRDFMWYNLRDNPCLAKLDSVLVSGFGNLNSLCICHVYYQANVRPCTSLLVLKED